MNTSAPIDFWFDFSSPYSYVANAWVDALAARHGREVRRHAILLGATFHAAELKSPVSYPLKREYSIADFARSARFEGVPYSPPRGSSGGCTTPRGRKPPRAGRWPPSAPTSRAGCC